LVVSDHEESAPILPGNLPEQIEDFETSHRIKGSGWLIRKQDRGISGNRPCDGDPLALTNG